MTPLLLYGTLSQFARWAARRPYFFLLQLCPYITDLKEEDVHLQLGQPCLLQGFQCLVDDHSGFGHFGADVMAELRTDYPNAPLMLYPVRPTQQAPAHAQVSLHALNCRPIALVSGHSLTWLLWSLKSYIHSFCLSTNE